MNADWLRELRAAATPGPWLADEDLAEYDAGLHNVWHGDPAKPALRAVAHDIFSFSDARLISLAPDLAELCADMFEDLAVLTDELGVGTVMGIQFSANVRDYRARLAALNKQASAGRSSGDPEEPS